MSVKLKLNFEVLFVIIFSIVFLYLAIGDSWDHRISHNFPYSYLASDAFFHESVSMYITEEGRVKNTLPSAVGNYEEVLDAHPPALFQLTGGLSSLSGLKAYDMILFVSVLCLLFAILAMYFVWRSANKIVAIFAISVGMMMISQRLTPLIYWGYWLLIVGIFFMAASFWAITKFDLKFSFIPLSLFFSAAALSHQPEFAYAGLFFAIVIVVKVIKQRKISKDLLKKVIGISALILVFSLYSLLIFSKTFLISEGYRNVWDMSKAVGGYPEFNLVHLGVIGIVAAVGLALFTFSKKRAIAGYISLFCFLLGYLIYLGLGKRAYAHRLFWFIYISFFFGYALYFAYSLIVRKKAMHYAFIVAVILLIVLAFSVNGKTKFGQGIMDQYDWAALMWISENIPKDAYVYYFYSDALSPNAPIYNSGRVGFNIKVNEYIQDIQSQQLKPTYLFGIVDGYKIYLHEKSPFSFCFYDHRLKPLDGSYGCNEEYEQFEDIPQSYRQKDICKIEYYYFAKQASQPVLAQYNMAVRNVLLQNDYIEEIYSNPLISILKNNNLEGDCLAAAS